MNLVSLAYIQSCGGSYWSIGTNRLAVAGLDGKPFDTVLMQPNRLYSPSLSLSSPLPLSYPAINRQSISDSTSTSDSDSDSGSDIDILTANSASGVDVDADADDTDTVLVHDGSDLDRYLSFPALRSSHCTTEQRLRCDSSDKGYPLFG